MMIFHIFCFKYHHHWNCAALRVLPVATQSKATLIKIKSETVSHKTFDN
jgi:hypothetical protein